MPRLPSFLARKPLVVRLGVNSQNSEVLVRHDIIPVLEWELGMHVPLDELLSSIARARSRRGDGTSIIIFDKPAPDNLLYLRSLLMAPRSLSLFRKWSTQIGTALFHSIDSYVEVLSSAGETVPWYSTKILWRRLFFRPLNHGPVRKASGGQFYCTRVLQWAWSGMPPLLLVSFQRNCQGKAAW